MNIVQSISIGADGYLLNKEVYVNSLCIEKIFKYQNK